MKYYFYSPVPCILSCDGRPVAKAEGGDKVTVSRSSKELLLAKGKYDFFAKIKQKLG